MTTSISCKHNRLFKHYDISNILRNSEKTLNAMWRLMEKHNLPQCEVTLKCKKKQT